MEQKHLVWLGVTIGSAGGGFIGYLLDGGLGIWSIVFTALGGILGIWLGLKLAD